MRTIDSRLVTGTALRVERRGPITRLVLCRPERLNLFDDQLADELRQALADVRRDERVDTVVLTADGQTFSAGADLRREGAPSAAGDGPPDAALTATHELFRLLETLPQTTIAGVSGDALGAGVILALLCDLVVVADDARLGFTMGRFGLADGISTTRLAARVGLTVANDLLLTGRILRGREAYELRLAARSAPRERFEACLEETVGGVRAVAPLARRRIKEALQRPLVPYDFDIHLASYLSPEVAEGTAAFLQRRPPAWQHTAEPG